ncbi:MAG: YpdA family putative bacillithiol disulfide reductase [Gemmatimonadaceae bacterium]|jgi:thioredoxin reductase (NADPH)|nr:YpdA family putative bacillithiol disulfide reductase [Gemmatimonadaceae bacterium]
MRAAGDAPGVTGASTVARDVVVVGAGPCGLAVAIACVQRGRSCVVVERSSLVSGIASYPTEMVFFSTAERLSIGGVPFVVPGPKPTRRDALAYYRAVAQHFALEVHQYTTVTGLARVDDRWRLGAESRAHGAMSYEAPTVVIATGYFGQPNRLGVPGESLPHVTHRFVEGHSAFDQDVVVVGGANSAVDAALELHRAGARVTMVHFEDGLAPNVKPWVRPDIEGRLREGTIAARFGARVVSIAPDHVVVRDASGESRVAATQVYTMLGYLPENRLLELAGVPIDAVTGIPAHDPSTMRTSVEGVYLAGVLASGFDANKTFIENGRHHGELIVGDVIARRT